MADKISRISVILANPEYDQDSQSQILTNLCKSFIESAQKKGISIDFIDLYREDEFNPIFDPNEKDTKVLEYQIRLKRSQLLVIFHPVWWSLFPANLKGFLDKVFTRGFAFETRKNFKTGLLGDKKALIFCVGEKPVWQERFLYRDLLGNFWTKAFFPNLKIPSKLYHFGNMRAATPQTVTNWTKKVQKVAQSLNSRDSLLDLI